MTKSGGGIVDRVVSIALATAALAVAGSVVYRELVPVSARLDAGASAPETGKYFSDWRSLLGFVRYVGDSSSEVRLIEFTDLECPACRRFHEQILPELRKALGSTFSVGMVHLPLAGHRFAKTAAHAAECAADQGRFGEFVDLTMTKQDSIGLKSWGSFAQDAGVADEETFADCVTRPRLPPAVDSGVAAAARLGIHATPTVLVNGWHVPFYSVPEVTRVIRDIGAGRRPYPD